MGMEGGRDIRLRRVGCRWHGSWRRREGIFTCEGRWERGGSASSEAGGKQGMLPGIYKREQAGRAGIRTIVACAPEF